MGGNLEGVRAAALSYFGKEPRRLTLGEAALLVAARAANKQKAAGEGCLGEGQAALEDAVGGYGALWHRQPPAVSP